MSAFAELPDLSQVLKDSIFGVEFSVARIDDVDRVHEIILGASKARFPKFDPGSPSKQNPEQFFDMIFGSLWALQKVQPLYPIECPAMAERKFSYWNPRVSLISTFRAAEIYLFHPCEDSDFGKERLVISQTEVSHLLAGENAPPDIKATRIYQRQRIPEITALYIEYCADPSRANAKRLDALAQSFRNDAPYHR